MKKDVRKALETAKELEKKPLHSKEEIVKIYKEGMEEAEKLRKLLKPQWFMADPHKTKTAKTAKKKAKTRKKAKTSTRKKKAL